MKLVRGNRIVLVDLIDGDVLRLIIVLVLFRSRRIVKHRIVLQLRLDLLLQFLNRQLDELDRLNLERGKFLSLFEF